MKILPSLFICLLISGFSFSPPAKAGVVINFDDQATFDATFPTSSRSSAGNASAVSLVSGSPSRVKLHAEETAGGVSRMTLYSTASSEFDFIDSQKTFTFTNVSLTFAASGATYSTELGVFSSNTQNILGGSSSNPGDGIYFQAERTLGKLHLYQIVNNVRTELASWSAPNKPFPSLSLTLDSQGWSVNGVNGSGEVISNANATAAGALTIGNFATTPTSGNWGSNFYLGLQVDNSSSQVGRFADLTLQSITVVPEPKGLTLTLLTAGAVFLLARRR